MSALEDVLQSRMIKRGVPVKNLDFGELEPGTGTSVRRTSHAHPGHSAEGGQEDRQGDQGAGLKKIQASIQGDEIRVSGPSKDDLQAVDGAAPRPGLRRSSSSSAITAVEGAGSLPRPAAGIAALALAVLASWHPSGGMPEAVPSRRAPGRAGGAPNRGAHRAPVGAASVTIGGAAALTVTTRGGAPVARIAPGEAWRVVVAGQAMQLGRLGRRTSRKRSARVADQNDAERAGRRDYRGTLDILRDRTGLSVIEPGRSRGVPGWASSAARWAAATRGGWKRSGPRRWSPVRMRSATWAGGGPRASTSRPRWPTRSTAGYGGKIRSPCRPSAKRAAGHHRRRRSRSTPSSIPPAGGTPPMGPRPSAAPSGLSPVDRRCGCVRRGLLQHLAALSLA